MIALVIWLRVCWRSCNEVEVPGLRAFLSGWLRFVWLNALSCVLFVHWHLSVESPGALCVCLLSAGCGGVVSDGLLPRTNTGCSFDGKSSRFSHVP